MALRRAVGLRSLSGAMAPATVMPRAAAALPLMPQPPGPRTLPMAAPRGLLASGAALAAVLAYKGQEESKCEEIKRPGLMRDVKGEYFTSVLNEADAQALGRNAWEDVKKDAAEKKITPDAYLKDVAARTEKFCESRAMHDRDDLLNAMRGGIARKGSLTMLLGGSNVGKSMAIKKFVEELNKPGEDGKHKNIALLVNGRRYGGNLSKNIQVVLGEYLRKHETWPETLKRAIANMLQDFKVRWGDVEFQATIRQQEKGAMELIEQFVKTAEEHGMRPYLFLDEANLFLLKSTDADPATKELVELLIHMTKETAVLTVFMAATEFMFPFRMQRYDFHIDKTSSMIHAGEAPPPDMRALCQKLGLGQHVANGIMSACGGHVWLTLQAIERLVQEKENFTYGWVVPADAHGHVMECLERELQDQQQQKNKQRLQKTLLWRVAVDGFVEVEKPPEKDSVIHTMLEKNVVAFVAKKKTTAVGLPPEKWGKADYGIVPASQQMRLVIIDKLLKQLE